MTNKNITYVLKWSDTIDDKFIEDFLSVENSVLGGFTQHTLEQKIIHNIYGLSLITIAYLDEEPIGVDAMIRNDVGEQTCFETIDTCVLEKSRGVGVFSSITKKEVEEIKRVYPEAYIYGFPNANSYPGYVKMKWTVQNRLYPTIFLCPFLYNLNNQYIIDLEYGKWLNKSSQEFFYFKRGRNYYLIKQGRKHILMIGRIESKAALLFKRKKHPGMIKYFCGRKSFFNNNNYNGSIVTSQKIPLEIPYWKCDTFLN